MLISDWSSDVCSSDLWVIAVCGPPLWQYLLLFVYPGIALSLVRSFPEHQARPEVSERSVIVESGPLMSLLFLNNNLHLVHHDKPGLPWYRIPAFYRQRRDLFLASNGGYHFKGYREVFRNSEERRVGKGGVRTCDSRWSQYH